MEERLVFSKPYSEVCESPRMCKTIHLSNNEIHLFSAGLSHEVKPSAAYISVHSVKGSKIKEISTILYDKSSHRSKKGFYRLESLKQNKNLARNVEVLIAGNWLDICIFSFNEVDLQHIYTYKRIHTDLIYNIITFKKDIYTCSDDCTINKISLF